MNMRFHWLRCHESQWKFQFYWGPGAKNWVITVPNTTLHYITIPIVQHMQSKTIQVPPILPTGFLFTYFSF